MINERVFKKYDIRGEVEKDLKIEETYALSLAIAFYLKQQKPDIKDIAIGMDGRIHSPAIKKQICNGLIDSGLNVTFIGLCTTPALYFATHTLPVDAGIMITASHNPKEDNGLKITLEKESVWADQITAIKDLYLKKTQIKTKKIGLYKENNIIEKYTDWLTEHFQLLKGSDVNTIIDCGNGAAGSVLPILIKKLDLKNIKLIYSEIDGNFPNHEPDPTVETNMLDLKHRLLINANNSINYGIGFDGDCDRFAIMAKNGKLIPGDQLLAIFSQFILKDNNKNNIIKNNVVVFDIKCSDALIEVLQKSGLQACISPTGFAFVKNLMKKHNALLGGELSGHYCFNDRYFGYDDGIYAMLRLFEIIKVSGKNINELLDMFPKRISSREFRIECPEAKKLEIINMAKKILSSKSNIKIMEMDGIRAQMEYGWGLLRASNTQAMLSLRFEGNNEPDLLKVKNDFFDAMSPHFENNWLKKQLDL